MVYGNWLYFGNYLRNKEGVVERWDFFINVGNVFDICNV